MILPRTDRFTSCLLSCNTVDTNSRRGSAILSPSPHAIPIRRQCLCSVYLERSVDENISLALVFLFYHVSCTSVSEIWEIGEIKSEAAKLGEGSERQKRKAPGRGAYVIKGTEECAAEWRRRRKQIRYTHRSRSKWTHLRNKTRKKKYTNTPPHCPTGEKPTWITEDCRFKAMPWTRGQPAADHVHTAASTGHEPNKTSKRCGLGMLKRLARHPHAWSEISP